MSRYRIATRAYPTKYWAEHGDEIMATANELHLDRWSFRESRQLLANGLRTRSFEATGGELRRVWVQGLAIWLFVILLNMNRGWGRQLLGTNQFDAVGPTWSSVALLVALAAMASSTGWPAMLLVAGALLQFSLFDETAGPLWFGLVLIAATTIPIAAFGDGRRVVSPAVLMFLFAAATASTSLLVLSPLLIGPALLICGLALVRLDARILAAAKIHALVLTSIITVEVLFPEPSIGFNSPNDPSTALVFGGVAALAAVAAALSAVVTWRTRLAARHF